MPWHMAQKTPQQKLAILSDAEKYDASCASSGTTRRDSRSGGIGSAEHRKAEGRLGDENLAIERCKGRANSPSVCLQPSVGQLSDA